MKGKQLIVLGQPGTGVKKQAIALAERWHVPFVSVDELVQQEIAEASELGTQAKGCLDAGERLPNAILVKLLRRRIEQPDMLDGWVLVDFPQSVAQVHELDELLMRFEREPVEVAYLKGRTGLLISRIVKETRESTRVIRDRLTQHEKATLPVIELYARDGRLTTVNGCLNEKEVANALYMLGHQETGAAALIHDEAELDALLAEDTLIVVDGMASWCGSCKLVAPMVDQLAEAYGDRAKVVKMDFDANKQIPKRFGLKGMPAVMFFKGGELKETLTGVKPYKTYSATVTSLLE
ncbi:MAG: nucleoside monophosphate kinase [Cyanobacteria bacterium P01_D01_bin.105]